MKNCPACNFSFPDSHFVCDFDGAGLISNPEHLALIKLPARPSLGRRFMKSPKTLTALAILGLFVAAVFIGHQQTTLRSSQSLQAVSVAMPSLKTSTKEGTREVYKPPADPIAKVATTVPTHTRRSSLVRASLSKMHPKLRIASRQTEVARGSERASAEKQPRLVAVLKTTWRVLKRPFSF